MPKSRFGMPLAVAFPLAFVVVVLGAWVRLSDAGLGCPDWPGCYGQLLAPEGESEILRANQAFPERPVESAKAWKEMIHRYAAGLLGLLVVGMAGMACFRRGVGGKPLALPIVLGVLIVFQALLGMWTVTLQLKPVVVLAHLLGGFGVLGLLWLMVLQVFSPRTGTETYGQLKTWAVLGLGILLTQVALGGWTSANYAALACPDFPQCQAAWWPTMDFPAAFTMWRGLGVNYEFGVLDSDARTAIHVSHRFGAAITFAYLAALCLWTLRHAGLRRVASITMALLLVQVTLGVLNVVLVLPIPVAVGHNAVAALLVVALVTLIHRVWVPRPRPRTAG